MSAESNSSSFARVVQTFNGSTVVQIWDNSETSFEGAKKVSFFLLVSILSIFFLLLRALFSMVIGGANVFLWILRFVSGINIPFLPPFLEIWNDWNFLHRSVFIIFALVVLVIIYTSIEYIFSQPAGRRRIQKWAGKIIEFIMDNLLNVSILIAILAIGILLTKNPRPASEVVQGSPNASASITSISTTSQINKKTSTVTIQSMETESSVTEETTIVVSTTAAIVKPSIENSKTSTDSQEITTSASSTTAVPGTSTDATPLDSTTQSSSSVTTAKPSPDTTTVASTTLTPGSVGGGGKKENGILVDLSLPKLIYAIFAQTLKTSVWGLKTLKWAFETSFEYLFKIPKFIKELPGMIRERNIFGRPCAGSKKGACIRSVGNNLLGLVALCAATLVAHYSIQTTRSLIPGSFNVAASILLYQPVFWGIVFFLGYFIPFPFGWIETRLRYYWNTNRYFVAFVALASFKFFKSFVHIFSYYLYTNPAKSPTSPTVTPKDVTVIVSTVGNFSDDFAATIRSILVNQPSRLILATVGPRSAAAANTMIGTLPYALIGKTKITVDQTSVPNKRSQFISAASTTTDAIICYADDSVIWPKTFLKSALAPFEDQLVGMVGTVKKVERVRSKGLFTNILNFVGCIYLERHNFECTATYNIDGGVFVISGRTGLIRRSILEEFDFRNGFLNERFEFGPLASALMKPDDDNYMTRYCHKHGWKTVFHNDKDACVGTVIGVAGDSITGRASKLSGQLARWARSTWRSNLVTLFHDRVCYQSYPWTTYAMFVSSFVNLAIIYDPLMLGCLWLSGPESLSFCGVVMLLLLSKLVKPIQFFMKEPYDLWLLPFGIFFGYIHSLVRLYALFTITSVDWNGRKLN